MCWKETRLKQRDDLLRKLQQEISTSANVLINVGERMQQVGPLSSEQQEYANLSKSTCNSLLQLTKQLPSKRPEA